MVVGYPAAILQVLDKALVRPGRFDKQVSYRSYGAVQHSTVMRISDPVGCVCKPAVPICCALVACARSRVCAGMERGLR